MKTNLHPDQAARLVELLRDDFDNCPTLVAFAQHETDCIELTRAMYHLTGLECFLEAANQMQRDYEIDYPIASDEDPNWQENASPNELNRTINPNRL
jgi:hypothetical protein